MHIAARLVALLLVARVAPVSAQCPLPAKPDLPPLQTAPPDAAAEAFAKRLTQPIARRVMDADAAVEDDQVMVDVLTLIFAIRAAPDYVLARTTLAHLLEEVAGGGFSWCHENTYRPDATLAAWLAHVFLDLAESAMTGCDFCYDFAARWIAVYGDGGGGEPDDPFRVFHARLERGPVGPVGDAARAALSWLASGGEATGEGEAAPSPLGPMVEVNGQRMSRAAFMRAWFEGSENGPPELYTGNWHHPLVWRCRGKCCEMPFRDQGHYTRQVTSMCLAGSRLESFSWTETSIP